MKKEIGALSPIEMPVNIPAAVPTPVVGGLNQIKPVTNGSNLIKPVVSGDNTVKPVVIEPETCGLAEGTTMMSIANTVVDQVMNYSIKSVSVHYYGF